MTMVFGVNDTRETVAEPEAKGFRFISDQDGKAVRPFRDCEFALIRPGRLDDVLPEFIDYKWSELREDSRPTGHRMGLLFGPGPFFSKILL